MKLTKNLKWLDQAGVSKNITEYCCPGRAIDQSAVKRSELVYDNTPVALILKHLMVQSRIYRAIVYFCPPNHLGVVCGSREIH